MGADIASKGREEKLSMVSFTLQKSDSSSWTESRAQDGSFLFLAEAIFL
jgi:hypothetical protein